MARRLIVTPSLYEDSGLTDWEGYAFHGNEYSINQIAPLHQSTTIYTLLQGTIFDTSIKKDATQIKDLLMANVCCAVLYSRFAVPAQIC